MLFYNELKGRFYMGLDARKPVFRVCEQQRCRLVSAFVIGFLESIIILSKTCYMRNFDFLASLCC